MSSFRASTPPIGQVVIRTLQGVEVEDWCLQKRFDHGKYVRGAFKVIGENTWIEYGIVVWRSDYARHNPWQDRWRYK